MTAIFLSVHPKWADMILDGKKTVEFRTKDLWSCAYHHEFGKDEIPIHRYMSVSFKALLYSTAPLSMVIGEVTIRSSFLFIQDGRWPKLLEWGCMTAEELGEYANGRKVYANMLADPVRYDEPRHLSVYGMKRPPQSYAYVDDSNIQRRCAINA